MTGFHRAHRCFSKPLCTADSKEGADSDLDKYLPEADVVITTPFHPGYINADRIAKAPKLKLALTAGIGSDHVDLKAAAEHGVTVAEITGGCGALLFGAPSYLGSLSFPLVTEHQCVYEGLLLPGCWGQSSRTTHQQCCICAEVTAV